MSTPASSSPENHFDDLLRDGLDGLRPAPIQGGWERLRGRLPAPPPPAPPPSAPPPGRWARARTFGGGVLVGALLWWGGGQVRPGGEASGERAAAPPLATCPESALAAQPPAEKRDAPNAAYMAPATLRGEGVSADMAPATLRGSICGIAKAPPQSCGSAPTGAVGGLVGVSVTGAVPTKQPETPIALPSTVEIRDTLIRHEARAYVAPLVQPADSARAARLRGLVAEQTRALAALQTRLDSVKRFLPEAPPALAAAPPDSLARRFNAGPASAFPPPAPWAVVGLLETTPQWAVPATAAPGTNEEHTQAALTQSLLLQRQVGARWRLRAGVGQAILRTEGRYTADRLTTTTTTTETIERDTVVHNGIRAVLVVGPGPTDSTYYYITVSDTLFKQTTQQQTFTTTERNTLRQLLRPTHRFWTVPVAASFGLVQRERWRLGATLSGQLGIYRGGEVAVWDEGRAEFVLRRVSARQGPYRPVSLSLSAGLEAEYRLTPRLSVLLAPMARRWVVAPGRGAGQGRRVLPAVQAGVSMGF